MFKSLQLVYIWWRRNRMNHVQYFLSGKRFVSWISPQWKILCATVVKRRTLNITSRPWRVTYDPEFIEVEHLPPSSSAGDLYLLISLPPWGGDSNGGIGTLALCSSRIVRLREERQRVTSIWKVSKQPGGDAVNGSGEAAADKAWSSRRSRPRHWMVEHSADQQLIVTVVMAERSDST